MTLREIVEATEKGFIERALQNRGGNVSWAADDLGVSRRTLHLKITRYGIPGVPNAERPRRVPT